jgi:hypothetical protein
MVGPLGGGAEEFRSVHHQHLETSMAGPLGMLPEKLGAPTINIGKTSMAVPLGGVVGWSESGHHQC